MGQEDVDISPVKAWCKAAHVEDPDAVSALIEGRGVFDVSPSGQKMDAFVKEHALQNHVQRGDFTGLAGHRKIYFAFKSKPH
jgi:hypothetical protein